jgi:hypothetical protein
VILTATPAPVFHIALNATLVNDVWTILLLVVIAVATLGLAIGTFILAKATKEVAKDTVAAARLADRHHKESNVPIVSLSQGAFWIENMPEHANTKSLLSFKYWVTNSGNGPALNVQIIAEVALKYVHVGPPHNVCGP